MGEGRGGAENGRVESRLAVSAVLAHFRSSSINDPKRRLVEALDHAGQVLYQRCRSAAAFSDAWAACTAILVRRGRLYGARVGDIHVQVLRGRRAHSLFGTSGEGFPVLGMEPKPRVDSMDAEIGLEGGERVVMGKTTFFRSVAEEELMRVGGALVPTVAARRLVEAARKVGETSPLSVQVVQVGEAAATGAQSLEEGTPVAPVQLHGQARLTPPELPPGRPRVPTNIKVGSRRARGKLPMWTAIIAVSLGLIYFAWPFDSKQKSNKPVIDAPMKSTAARVAVNTGDTSDEFWEQVSGAVASENGALDQDKVKGWLQSEEEAARRLKEAKAVIAALEPSAVDNTANGSTDGLVAAKDAPVGDAPDVPAVKQSEGGSDNKVNVVWDPARLPTNLRRFEHIFSMEDPRAAAIRLRNYIHRRHRRANKVIRLLNSYIEMAPKARTLAVLEKLKTVRAGPRTRRWGNRQLKVVKQAMTAQQ